MMVTRRRVESCRFPLAHRAAPLTLQFRTESARTTAERTEGGREVVARELAALIYNHLPGWLVDGLRRALDELDRSRMTPSEDANGSR